MKKIKIFLLMLPVLFLFNAASSQSMYLKIDKIPGEAKDNEHKDWINLLSFKQGVSTNTSSASSGRATRGNAEFKEMTVTKSVDKATPLLLQKCAAGEVQPEVIMSITSANGRDFYTIRLTDVIISSITSSAECNPRCVTMEEVSFSYSRIAWEYSANDGTKVQSGYDIKANRKL